MIRFARATGRIAREGFTLLEVMIGILILALAMLGLGAVIPVVVRTQKAAADASTGVAVANGVEAYLSLRSDLNRLRNLAGTGRMGWGVWLLDPNWSPETGTPADQCLWEPPATTELIPATGEFRLEFAPSTPVVVGVGDRLWPSRFADGTDPQYVWDVMARRVRVPDGQPRQIQVALFVRRIDLNIRVPRQTAPGQYQWTLYDVLTGTVPQGQAALPAGSQRLPVAIDGTSGLPTGTGQGEYAAPLVLDVVFDPQYRDRLILPNAGNGSPNERMLARQVGQKWVDNLGNVYTVQGADELDQNGERMFIDPPVPAWVLDPTGPGVLVENTLRQIAFTPQVPASVTVFTLTPLDPK